MVYKVCEFKGIPRLKISEEPEKTTIAGSKSVIRALDADGFPVYDILCLWSEYELLLSEPQRLKVFDRINKEEIDTSNITLVGLSKDLFVNGEIAAERKDITLI